MPHITPIDDPHDPRVEPFRNVRDRDLAGRHGGFIAEGEVVLRVLARSRGSLVVVLIIIIFVLVLPAMLLALVVTSVLVVWVIGISVVVPSAIWSVLRSTFFRAAGNIRLIIISITALMVSLFGITALLVVITLTLVLVVRICVALLMMAVAVIVMTLLLRVSRHVCVLKESPVKDQQLFERPRLWHSERTRSWK